MKAGSRQRRRHASSWSQMLDPKLDYRHDFEPKPSLCINKMSNQIFCWYTPNLLHLPLFLQGECIFPLQRKVHRHSQTGAPLLVLASPIETVARDLEAQALAFIAPSCKLLFLQGSFKELNSCIARFR